MADEKTKLARPVITLSLPDGGQVNVAGNDHISPRTGSIGYNFNAPVVGNKGVKYQLTGNLTIQGTSAESKNITDEAKAEAQARAAAATVAQAAKVAARK